MNLLARLLTFLRTPHECRAWCGARVGRDELLCAECRDGQDAEVAR